MHYPHTHTPHQAHKRQGSPVTKGGFIKLFRKVLEHPWLNDRPEYRAAWDDILLLTDYKTREVCLSTVPSKRFFSSSSWSRFVKRLAADGMIEEVQTHNLGKHHGKVQYATVSNYFGYHRAGCEEGSSCRRDLPPVAGDACVDVADEAEAFDDVGAEAEEVADNAQTPSDDEAETLSEDGATPEDAAQTSREDEAPSPTASVADAPAAGEEGRESAGSSLYIKEFQEGKDLKPSLSAELLEKNFGKLLEALTQEVPARKRWFSLSAEQIAGAIFSASQEAGAFRTRLKENLDARCKLTAQPVKKFSGPPGRAARPAAPPTVRDPENTLLWGHDWSNHRGADAQHLPPVTGEPCRSPGSHAGEALEPF